MHESAIAHWDIFLKCIFFYFIEGSKEVEHKDRVS